MEKILIPPERKIAFILSGGEVYFFNLPSLSYSKSLIKGKNGSDIFINVNEPNCDNMLLVVNKKKIKLYDFEYTPGNPVLNEIKNKDTISLEVLLNCAKWTVNNNFIYSFESKILWLYFNKGTSIGVDIEKIVQIINLGEKVAVSNTDMTLFMKDGDAYQCNPIAYISHGGVDFQGYAEFKNHLNALYKNSLHIYKKASTKL